MEYRCGEAGGWRAVGNFVASLVENEVALEAAAPAAAAARRRQSVRPPRNNGQEASRSCPAGRKEAPSPVGEKGKGAAQVGAKDAASSKRKSSQKKKEEGGAPKAGAVDRVRGPLRREQQIAPQLKEAEDACEELEAPWTKAKPPPPPPLVRRKTGPSRRRTKALPAEEGEEEEEEEEEEVEEVALRQKEAGCEGRRRSRQPKGARGGGRDGLARLSNLVDVWDSEDEEWAEDACEELEAPRTKAKPPPPPPLVRRKTGSSRRRTKALPAEEEEEVEWVAQRQKEAGCEGRRRSRQQKGARREGRDGLASPSEFLAPLWDSEDEERAEGRPRMREVEPREEAPPVGPVLRKVLERLRLARNEVSEASAQVNEIEKVLLKTVGELCGRRVEPLRTGSYYERVKVCRPDEFDIMLIIPDLRVELEPCNCEASSGSFCYVKLPGLSKNDKLRKFLNADEQLSSTKLLSDLKRVIGDKVKKMEGGKICVQKTKPTSPAITLLLKAPPADISIDFTVALELRLRPKVPEGGLAIGEWLGTKSKREFCYKPSYLIPKPLKDGRLLRENTWRYSFSHIEKLMINNHGNAKTCCEAYGEKCCRKNCLKLLKYLLEQLKEKHKQRNQFNKFFSYHAKTAFFHACIKWPSDADWKEEDLAECFDRFLNFFKDCLRKTELNHFFIPEFNFFSPIRTERGKCAILARVIEQERNNGFPIFEEN